MLKSVFTKLFCGAVALSVFVLSACSDSLTDKNDILLGMLAASNSKTVQYGSLTINETRALNVSDISYVYAAVSGTGISSPITAKSETITDGSGSGSITVKGIPVGSNRVVTVYAYDSSNEKLGTVMLRGVTDIAAGNSNSINIDKSTTLLGNVFYELLSKSVNLASVDKTAVQSKISGATKSWALYDAAAIATDYVSASSAGGIKTIFNYEVSTGSVTFTNYYDGCTIQVGDPVSSIKTSVSAGEGSISGIAPGTWPVYVTQNGKQVVKTYATVTAGGTYSLGNLGTVTDRIIVHAKNYLNIYIFGTTGVTKGHYAMIDEGNDWYVYVIDATSANLIFTKKLNGWDSQTADLSREAGEWWYKDGTWYEANPDDSEAPVLVSFTSDKSGTVSENVVLTVEATDNLNLSKAVLTIDGAALTTINLSGKTSTITYTWETAYIANGSHVIKAVVYDSANLASNEKTLSFTTSNANLPPVAKISGPKKMSPGKTLTYKGTDSYDQNGGTIASYKWTVTGAAATSSLTGETLTVTAPSTVGATFKVSLVVKDNEGASSETVSVDCETIDVDANWDFRDETIYFLMTTRFYDGDSSNNRYCWDDEVHLKSKTNNDPGWRGDFKGLIDRLDYIKALGFTAIWITPVVENASGLDYHGYHATDFSKVDPRYESTGATYQDLIDKAHEKGIKIIQDIVLNHCSNSGEKHILPMTVKKYDSDNGVDCVPMVPDHNATDIYGRNTYELLNKGVKKLTGGKYNTYEELEKDANHYYDDAARGKLMYESRIYSMNNGLDIDNDEVGKLFHYQPGFEWENVNLQRGTMAGDCVDLNTENPKVAEYLRNCYIKYIQMGVDAFRIDTLKHISRLTMNKEFIPQFHEAAAAAGNDKFFMFGEACVKRNEVWNGNLPPISVCFYTWNQNKNKTDASYPWKGVSDYVAAAKDNLLTIDDFNDDNTIGVQLESNNVFLNGNDYHEPDYSKYSGLSVIDFYMHHKFKDPGNAIDAANQEDRYINDASWAVTYVDSHDFGPNEGGMLLKRFNLGTAAWAENLDLMFTFRGIPCVYYGSEVEFQAGKQIEPWCDSGKVPYNESGRAYFGDHLEGTISADGTGEYSASGAIKETLDSTLSQHIMRLNQIRAAVPALRKGQYSFENCNGSNAFKRRYTSNNVDSFAVVSISGSATFTGLPAGKYIDVVSGDVQTIGEGGTIKSKNSGQGSMAVYVNATLDSSITGKIGKPGVYLK